MADNPPMGSALPQKRCGLRVCMLAYSFYESDTRILQYATALAKRGDTVDVLALRRDHDQPEFEVLNGVNVYRIQSRTVNEKGLFSYANRFFVSFSALHGFCAASTSNILMMSYTCTTCRTS